MDENITLRDAIAQVRKVCGNVQINITCSHSVFDVEFSMFGPNGKSAGAVGNELVPTFEKAIDHFRTVIS
jgi:hypothetical protein